MRERRDVWCRAADAALADALATAFMVMEREAIERYCQDRKDVAAILVSEGESSHDKRSRIQRYGEWEEADILPLDNS